MAGTSDERDHEPPVAPIVATSTPSSDENLDRFRTLVLADVVLQERLRASDDADQFVALTLAAARDHGFQFSDDDTRQAMRHRLPGLSVYDGDVHETRLPPKGWLPIDNVWQHGELYLRWSYFGERRLREPFFEGDVRHSQLKPFNRLFRYVTPITKLPDWLQSHPGLRPRGFIFHMSRCGSTLVSQMLASLDRTVVVSEAPPIDAVVRARDARPDLNDDQWGCWLAWIIGVLGQPRGGSETDYFIKLDCWHTLALPLFRRAFPDVPWIFLYRDPVEVLVSQFRMPGIQMVPGMLGPNPFGFEPIAGRYAPDDYAARVLARICEPILEHDKQGGGLLVNYRELPQALWTRIMPHFGVACSDHDRAVMTDAARFDAKMPSFEFTPDIDDKQRQASAATRAVAEERLGSLYRRLEALRMR